MPTFQRAPVEKPVQTPADEMRLLSRQRVIYNLTKSAISNQSPNALLKLTPAHYSSKGSGGGDGQKKQNLLKYHVLPLKETLDRFMLTAQPHLTPKEFDKQWEITNQFEQKEGTKLQRLLEEVGNKEENWLAHRWLKAAYMQYRDPVTVFISPGMTFPAQDFKDLDEYVNFTAKVIYGLGEFKSIVDADEIPIVKMGKHELDNSQFGKVFGTCRIPKPKMDEIEYNPDSKYVVVIYKNHFYRLCIYGKSDEVLSSTVLAKHLKCIMESEKEFGVPYGILTTDSRDNWAESHEQLSKQPQNVEALETIRGALFTVSLDECVPFEPADRANQHILSLIHGGGSCVNSANRWMDKTIQLVVNPNGNVGFSYEHSPAEGQPIAMMMDYVMKKLNADKNYGECGAKDNGGKPEKIRFCPVNPCIEQWLHTAERNLDKLAKSLQMNVYKFDCFGKGYIKTKRLGPDSFVQMALQLAFYKMHKVPGAQYESAHLRVFVNGRTETIRSCSNESLAFCKGMTSDKVSMEERACLLRAAVEGHQAYAKLALLGRGVDRHLLGLKMMALENDLPIPSFYESPGYTRSMHYRVSTSQVATSYDAFMGYGPATDDGYGICYNPRENDIILAISAWRANMDTNPVAFAKALESAFVAMKDVLDLEPPQMPKSKL